MKNSKLQIPSWIQRAERGEDASFEFVTWVPILMFLVLTIAFVGIYWSSRIPARQAATECVRMAIATLDENIGIPQGIQAGYDSLKKDDTRKNIGFVSNVNVGFDPGYVWARGKPLTCRVQYRIKFDNGLFDLNGNAYTPQPLLDINEAVTLNIEPLKSQWKKIAAP